MLKSWWRPSTTYISLKGKMWRDWAKENPLSTEHGILPRIWRVAPPPACFIAGVGLSSKSESLKPNFLKVSAPIQLKNEFPESTYPFSRTFFGPIRKVTSTFVLRGWRSRLPICAIRWFRASTYLSDCPCDSSHGFASFLELAGGRCGPF